MKKTGILLVIIVLLSGTGIGQEIREFSLQEAQTFALENNYNMRIAKNDVEIARKQVKESLAIGLPQVDGSVSTTNYLNIPTTLIPDFITPSIYAVNENDFGLEPEVPLGPTEFFPAQFGTEYNANVDITAAQLLFSGQYIIGVKTANTFLDKTRLDYLKDELDVNESVSRSYYYVLVTEENYQNLKANLESLKDIADQTRETYEIGFIEESDADQLDILVSDLETSLLDLHSKINIAYSQLKYTLGLDVNDSITLTDNFNTLLNEMDYLALITTPFNHNNYIDYKILNKQKEIAISQVKLEQSTYLPTLTAFFSAQTMAMRNDFDFFNTSKPWYPSTFWGVEMNIPIWSSGTRSAKVQKAKLNLKNMNVMDDQLKNGLNIYVYTAKTDFTTAYLVYRNKKEKLELSDKINKTTEEKFKEGIASSLDLLQTQNQYLEADTEYTNSILDLLDKKLILEKYLTQSE